MILKTKGNTLEFSENSVHDKRNAPRAILHKIWLSLSILVVGYFISMLVVFASGKKTELNLFRISESLFPATGESQLALFRYTDMVNNYEDAVMTGEESFLESAMKNAGIVDQALDTILSLKGLPLDQRAEVQSLSADFKTYTQTADAFYENMLTRSLETMDGIRAKQLADKAEGLDRRFLRLYQEASTDLKTRLSHISETTRRIRYSNLIVFFIVVASGLLLIAMIVSKTIIRPLRRLYVLEQVVEQCAEGIAVAGLDETVQFVNKAWGEMHGYPEEGGWGKPLSGFVRFDARPSSPGHPFAAFAKERGFHRGEIDHQRRDKTTFPAVETMTLIRDYEKAPMNFVAIARDITEKKNAEKALKKAHDRLEIRVRERTAELARANQVLWESQNRYNALFLGITDGVLVHYASRIPLAERFIEANAVVAGMLGYSTEEMERLSFECILDDENSDYMLQILRQLVVGKPALFEQTLVRKNGESVLVEIHTRQFKLGERQAVLYMIRDIGERKKTEEVVIQAEKMMSVGGLAAGMAHEINNPLAAVIQNSILLENRLTDTTMPANIQVAQSLNSTMDTIFGYMEKRGIPRIARNIRKTSIRMSSIVENMLGFARKSDATFSSHDPIVLMDKILDLASLDYDRKKNFDFKSIAIEKEYQENLPKVPCESGKIQQVILNILRNGAHAMFEASKEIQPKFILRLIREETPNMLRIEIEDNGPGMDPDTCKRVFEPFYTTKPVGVGTGLGLSVSYFIITENHGGTINAASQPGQGTNFIIRLPLERPAPDLL